MSITITEEQLQNLLKAAVGAVQQGANDDGNGNDRPRVKNPERPEIDLGYSETQWAFFLDEWDVYKRRAALKAEHLTDELRACCSKDLRKTLFDFVGSSTLAKLSEQQLLEKIKSAAVIGKNRAVHRKEFHEIQQEPDEPVNRLVAKLRAKAERCNFTLKCSAIGCQQINSYAEEMVNDQMTYGLYDKDIQQEVLARDKTLENFEETYELIEAYELGKQAKAQLDSRGTSEVNAFKSQYKAQQRQHTGLKQICQGCGTTKHSGQQREEVCEAWGEKCKNCGKFNHFKEVCQHDTKEKRQEDKPKRTVRISREHEEREPEESHSYGAAAAWDDSYGNNVSWFLAFGIEVDDCSTFPHVEWNEGRFVKANPLPLPSIKVQITPLLDYHEQFLSTELQSNSNQASVDVYTDTCAQTCIAGEALLHEINVDRSSLIPTSHRIVGVTKQPLDVLGVLLAKVEYAGNVAHMAIYVCDGVDSLFLSRRVQSCLGIISEDYPCAQMKEIPSSMQMETRTDIMLDDPAIVKHGPPVGLRDSATGGGIHPNKRRVMITKKTRDAQIHHNNRQKTERRTNEGQTDAYSFSNPRSRRQKRYQQRHEANNRIPANLELPVCTIASRKHGNIHCENRLRPTVSQCYARSTGE